VAAYSASSQAGESGRAATLSRLASLRAATDAHQRRTSQRTNAGRVKGRTTGGQLGGGGSGGRAPGKGAAEAEAAVRPLLQKLGGRLRRLLAEGAPQLRGRDVRLAQPARPAGPRSLPPGPLCQNLTLPYRGSKQACACGLPLAALLHRRRPGQTSVSAGPGAAAHRSKSQMPCASSSARVSGCEGRKCPSRPVAQSPGISQMRKKPRMWSMRKAWKYLPGRARAPLAPS